MKSNKRSRIIFRADGSTESGLGHVFRLLAIAQIFRNNFELLFVVKEIPESLKPLIRTQCPLTVLDNRDELEQMKKIAIPTDILVLDGYGFTTNYQKEIKSLLHKLVMIDDKADVHFLADLVINHGGEHIRHKYSTESYTKLLTGFQYLITRPEFLKAASNSRSVSKVDTVFICMGGSDPFNITIKALQACMSTSFIKKVIVVTGTAFAKGEELATIVEQNNRHKIVLHETNVDAERMVQLIRECEIAICPASTIAMEACCVRVGLLCGFVIDNQLPTHEQLLNAGCCQSAGDFKSASVEDLETCLLKLSSPTEVNSLISNQAKVIDGHSRQRLFTEFKDLVAC